MHRLLRSARVVRPPGEPAPDLIGRKVALAVAIAAGVTFWHHAITFSTVPTASHLPYLALDMLLVLPAAGVAIRLAESMGRRLGVSRDHTAGAAIARAALVSLVLSVLLVPVAMVQSIAHLTLGGTGGALHHGSAGLPADGVAGMVGYGVQQAIIAQPALLVVALLGTGLLEFSLRRIWSEVARPLVRPVATGAFALALVGAAGMLPLQSPLLTPAEAGGSGGCNSSTVPRRTYNVVAINVDIVVDRTGDHDPFGYMYTLAGKEAAVRAEEAALKAASSLPVTDPNAKKVTAGLRQDLIQPLILRARLGECVLINFTNKLTAPPRGGPGGGAVPVIVQPGGVPSVSIDMQGVSYDASGGDNGDGVGNNPASKLVAPGASTTYRYYVDPLMGEGARTFRSGGESTQLTAHGLFGALIAEPAGSRWFDPETGAEKTGDANWANWEAMIQPGSGIKFREFGIIYHEIGDENFNMRRPLRENPATPTPDQAENGAAVPMIDAGTAAGGGGNTAAYRPGSRALNYRSEPFWRRLQLVAARGDEVQKANESLGYSSYMFGEPSTPMPRSYLGEPTKTRLMHAGFEQLHVHHLHGGADRWRQNPGADDTDMDGGLKKTPIQNAKSIRLDSQTISPEETFNLEHECGAGGCQQAAGDFLYHCHIAHHYIAGMWSFWRVFDTKQPDLAPLPGSQAPSQAVNSAGLVGKTLSDGRTVIASGTSSSTQVTLRDLIEPVLPPQGVRFHDDDATVWDWTRVGDVYLGEPEDTRVWMNYASPTPGARPEIMFNPKNGRPAWPLLRPHLNIRPPFSPNGHSGAPWLGETGSSSRPDGLCPASAPVRRYDITAITVPIQATPKERDNNGEIFVLNEDKSAVLGGTKPADPLAIRSNVGDCVAITFGSELNPAVQHKVNMHTHFVQFDPQASDGVITGLSYEQSVFDAGLEGRTLVSVDAPNKVTVTNVTNLRPGIAIGVGVGRTSIEVAHIASISGNQLTFTSNLTKSHAAGEPVTVEFVQYRWFSDVDSGTVFWHDHVDGIKSWGHGLFGAHIIEPPGSTYHDPTTGAQVRSGAIVDIHTSGTTAAGLVGSFREYMIWLHNGRRGRPELALPAAGLALNFGQECEEGSINLRAAPFGERTPPGATPADPATTQQRQEWNGNRCRNSTSRSVLDPANPNDDTVTAMVTTVDPYVFSSVKYGDPMTPLLRAYVGDNVMIRTIGLGERAESLRIQGHRFRMERFNTAGQLMDAATTGISERFDYALDGGAGGPAGMPGDYLYYSSRAQALETGAWGIFRVFEKKQNNLQKLPNRTEKPTGTGFPYFSPATGDTQANPGPNPAPATSSNVSTTASPCPSTARQMSYDVSVFAKTLPSAPFQDTGGIIYSLTSDMSGIQAGTKPTEPLVLRANKGDCVTITLRNQIAATSLYGGTRAGFDLGKLLMNPQFMGGAAVGLNADTTVAAGSSRTYKFYADQELGTSIFQNLGSPASLRHGATGMLIVEPQGATWSDSFTNAPLGSTKTASQAIIRVGSTGPRWREFALNIHTTDPQYGKSIIPYTDVVAGSGINSTTTPANPPSADRGFTWVNYTSEPLTVRLGLTANPNRPDLVTPSPYHTAFSSAVHGDPDTPLVQTYAGDPVVFRVAVGASDQYHSFRIGGHMFPLEPFMWNGSTDKRSSLLSSRTLTGGMTLDAELATGAGGSQEFDGDYMYGDARQPFAAAGMWGVFRVYKPFFFGFDDAATPISPL